jgi:hypothetical protein
MSLFTRCGEARLAQDQGSAELVVWRSWQAAGARGSGAAVLILLPGVFAATIDWATINTSLAAARRQAATKDWSQRPRL